MHKNTNMKISKENDPVELLVPFVKRSLETKRWGKSANKYIVLNTLYFLELF